MSLNSNPINSIRPPGVVVKIYVVRMKVASMITMTTHRGKLSGVRMKLEGKTYTSRSISLCETKVCLVMCTTHLLILSLTTFVKFRDCARPMTIKIVSMTCLIYYLIYVAYPREKIIHITVKTLCFVANSTNFSHTLRCGVHQKYLAFQTIRPQDNSPKINSVAPTLKKNYFIYVM